MKIFSFKEASKAWQFMRECDEVFNAIVAGFPNLEGSVYTVKLNSNCDIEIVNHIYNKIIK